ncbi:hypothetical protein RND71_038016 [Anisodus tanguticus]|uniref:Uncharacterized protein n=1 Tax=Anisodus tanguticus TaxID=243964 RepID=A0AAE1QYV7_9SOLA|nr:hypothetical protein RND71_038016 [Anisodus tanguticus]
MSKRVAKTLKNVFGFERNDSLHSNDGGDDEDSEARFNSSPDTYLDSEDEELNMPALAEIEEEINMQNQEEENDELNMSNQGSDKEEFENQEAEDDEDGIDEETFTHEEFLQGSLLIIVTTLVIGFVIGIILNHFWPLFFKINNNGSTTSLVIPKGTFGWPLLGEILSFLKPHPSNSIGTFLFLQQHCSRYGKVFKSHLFFSPTVVSCDQDLNYFILQNEDKLFQCSSL